MASHAASLLGAVTIHMLMAMPSGVMRVQNLAQGHMDTNPLIRGQPTQHHLSHGPMYV